MEQLKLTDFLNYRFLSAVRYAPDGSRAAFVVSNCNEEENCYESRLWMYDGTLRQLTGIGKEGQFVWEDDTHILFPAVRSAEEQKRQKAGEQFTSFYRLDVTGGEAVQAFTLPFAVQEIYGLGNGKWLVLGRIDAGCPDYYEMSSEKRTEADKAHEKEKDYEVFDEIPFWGNGRGVTNKLRRALFIYDEKTGSCKRITDPLFQTDGYEVMGDTVYFTGDAYEAHAIRNHFSLYALDVPTGAVRMIREYTGLYGNGMVKVGNRLLILATEGRRHGLNENAWVYEVNTENGELTVIRQEEYNMYSSVGSDCRYGGGQEMRANGDTLYHLTTREGNSHLYALSMDGNSVPVVTKDGAIDEFDIPEKGGKALMVAMYDTRLQELYEADLKTGEVVQISHFNDAALEGKYVAVPQPLSVQSEGWTIGGWVLLPKDYDPSKSYPAVLDIHGGPKTVYGPVFYHEMQLWANMGYFVFFCNPMGSDGRDNQFMDIRGHYGETDYRNLMDFTDAVLEAYPQIDRARVCETGGSYGGFMTNWIIGHTDRFVCAASQRSIANWLSFYGVSDIGVEFAKDQCDADPINTPDKMWEHSPMRYAGNVKTPTLFIHSDEDYRCPLAEGLQMYTSLAAQGVPTRLCLFHGENHELSRSGKPQHRIRRLTEITNWFEKYARNNG